MNLPPATLPTLLMVMDDKADLHHFGPLLQAAFQVRIASSFERALQAAARLPKPDVILLGMTLTASQQTALREALPDVPCETFLKPAHLATLLETLRRHCGDAQPAALAVPPAALRVLLAEDDSLLQQVVGENLASAGVGFAIAANGEAALALAAREHFDWVLMDVHMPVMDGLTATRHLRADPRTAGLRIIALTGNTDAASRQACREAGMDDFLGKPIDADEMLARLGALPEDCAIPETAAAPAAGFDPAQLEKISAGQPARQRKYARHFLDTAPRELAAIDSALAGDDLPAVRQIAHRLKSAARWIGAQSLGNGLAALEQQAAAGDAPACRAAAAACRAASVDFFPRLEDFVRQLPES